MPTPLLGFDIGGTKSAALLGTADGQVLARRGFPSNAHRGPDAMLADLLAAARELIANAPQPPTAAGVAIGGPLNPTTGTIHSPPNLPGWDNFPLKSRLEQALQIPVSVHHDAAACALAEYHWGQYAKTPRLAYLTCGTGFGVGLTFNGQAYYGTNGRNPELGHWRIRENGPTAFGKQGSAEACCSAPALSRWATHLYPTRWPENSITPEHLAQLWNRNDQDATTVIEHHAKATGDAIALLTDLLHPDIILLGPLSHRLGNDWLTQVQSQATAESLHPSTINPATLGDKLQDLSALAAATA